MGRFREEIEMENELDLGGVAAGVMDGGGEDLTFSPSITGQPIFYMRIWVESTFLTFLTFLNPCHLHNQWRFVTLPEQVL